MTKIKLFFTFILVLFTIQAPTHAKVNTTRTKVLSGITALGTATLLYGVKKAYYENCKEKNIQPTIKGYFSFFKKLTLSFRYPRSRKIVFKKHPKLISLLYAMPFLAGAIVVSKAEDITRQKTINKALMYEILSQNIKSPTPLINSELKIQHVANLLYPLILQGADINILMQLDPWIRNDRNRNILLGRGLALVLSYNGKSLLQIACNEQNDALVMYLIKQGAHLPPSLKNSTDADNLAAVAFFNGVKQRRLAELRDDPVRKGQLVVRNPSGPSPIANPNVRLSDLWRPITVQVGAPLPVRVNYWLPVTIQEYAHLPFCIKKLIASFLGYTATDEDAHHYRLPPTLEIPRLMPRHNPRPIDDLAEYAINVKFSDAAQGTNPPSA